MREAIDALGGQNLKGVIIDLRGNPGGVLDGGVDIADLFLGARRRRRGNARAGPGSVRGVRGL